jgi:hypothetical protein
VAQRHEWKKQTHQPYKVEAMVLKRVVMKGQNPKHHDSAVYILNDEE